MLWILLANDPHREGLPKERSNDHSAKRKMLENSLAPPASRTLNDRLDWDLVSSWAIEVCILTLAWGFGTFVALQYMYCIVSIQLYTAVDKLKGRPLKNRDRALSWDKAMKAVGQPLKFS